MYWGEEDVKKGRRRQVDKQVAAGNRVLDDKVRSVLWCTGKNEKNAET